MEELIAFVKAENAKTLAWVAEDPTNRWSTLYSEDPEDWEYQGIRNLEDFHRNSLITFIYEAHKDAYGVKGRHYNFDEMTIDELKAEAERLSEVVSETLELERTVQAKNLEEFQVRVQETMELCNCDATRAVDHIFEAEDEDKRYGFESLEYHLNIPYGSIKKLLKEMA